MEASGGGGAGPLWVRSALVSVQRVDHKPGCSIACRCFFISVARGEDTWHSDLDVLLVTSTAEDARRAAERIWQRDGDQIQRYGLISVRALSRDELAERVRRGERWLVEACDEQQNYQP